MAKVSIYLRTDRLNKFGLAPVQMKIWEGSKPPYYHKINNVGVNPDLWIEDEYQVKPSHPNAQLINRKIKSEKLKIDTALLDMDMAEVPFDREYLKRKMNGHDDKSVYDFWQSVIDSRDGTLAPNTMRGYVAELSKLKQYKATLYFSEVTLQFLERYESWMSTPKSLGGRGNSPNTIGKTMKRFHYTIQRANKTIGTNCRAFDLYKKPWESTKRDVIDLETLDKMLELLYKRELPADVNEVLALFCLQALTGLRFSDAVIFDKRTFIQNSNIIISTVKTSEQVYIPIIGRLRDLLEFQGYAFKKMELYTANRHLKSIAIKFSLPFTLSTHNAVHSFCTISLDLGLPIEVISKIRGHQNIRTTQIYAKVKNPLIEREMQKWDNVKAESLLV